MTGDRSYRDSALSARRAARTHLAELRAARRARKGATRRVQTEQATSTDGQFAIDRDLLFAPPPAVDDVDTFTESSAPPDDPSAPVEDTEPGPESDAFIATDEITPPAMAETDPDEQEYEPQIATTEALVLPSNAVKDTPLPADITSDLLTLPGAGDGMIWLFHQCGITTLADLAQADAATLSQQLGVVGYILDIRPWIQFAVDNQAASGHASQTDTPALQ